MRNFSDKISRLNSKHTNLCPIIFSEKVCLLFDNVEKYFRAGHAADENTMHSHC
jgi:hypothetical protein